MRSIAICVALLCVGRRKACFNTASGMRSIAMGATSGEFAVITEFQYRKRYEVYCNLSDAMLESSTYWFQYRKRYEVYCNTVSMSSMMLTLKVSIPQAVWGLLQCSKIRIHQLRLNSFNTASGMRSIAMLQPESLRRPSSLFQYRKRYEVYCNHIPDPGVGGCPGFNTASGMRSIAILINVAGD